MRISDYTLDDFIVAFIDYDRDNYSHDGYEYLLGTYNEIAPDDELDVIAICCDWSEYSDEDEVMEDYGYLGDDFDEVRRQIENRSTIAELDNGGYMILAF